MLGSAPLHDVWDDTRGDGSQPFDDLSCVVKASGMRVAGCEVPVNPGMAWQPAQGGPQQSDRLLEPTLDETGHANTVDLGCVRMERAESDRGLQMLDRNIVMTGPEPQPSTYSPTAVGARIQIEGAVNQRECRLDIPFEISEHVGNVADYARIAG